MFKQSFFLFIPILNLIKNCISSRAVNQNIKINNCLIMHLTSTNSGGAISIDSSYSLNVNDTTFFECIALTGFGGAIYFNNVINSTNISGIQLLRICASHCKATYNQFSYLKTENNQILNLITVNNCNNLNGYYTFYILSGNQYIHNINISYNRNIAYSGIGYHCPNSMFTNYCTFYNNTVISSCCINLLCQTGNISKCNIILNNSPTNYGVVYVTSTGNYNFNECIFDRNNNTLFYVASGTLKLITCYINHLSHSIVTNTQIAPIFSPNLIITTTYYYSHSIYFSYYCSYSLNQINITTIPPISNTFLKTSQLDSTNFPYYSLSISIPLNPTLSIISNHKKDFFKYISIYIISGISIFILIISLFLLLFKKKNEEITQFPDLINI